MVDADAVVVVVEAGAVDDTTLWLARAVVALVNPVLDADEVFVAVEETDVTVAVLDADTVESATMDELVVATTVVDDEASMQM